MAGLRWRRDGDDHVLQSSFPLLGRRGPRFGPAGIEAGLLWRRLIRWPDVAAVTWDGSPDRTYLALCLHRDPWVHGLPAGSLAWQRTEETRALLEPIRPLVERMGARIEDRDEAATFWWHLQPEARRRR